MADEEDDVVLDEFVLDDPENADASKTGADDGKPADKDTDKGGGEAKPDRATLKRIEALEAELTTSRESERYWADRAKANGHAGEKPVAKDEPEADIDPGTPDELVDELTSKGIEALYKRGIPSKKDLQAFAKSIEEKTLASVDEVVERKIAGRVKAMERDAVLLREYPELSDPKSQFFTRTVEIAREIAGDDESAKNNPATLKAAARVAKAELAATGKRRPAADEDEPEFTPRERRQAQGAAPSYRNEDTPDFLSSSTKEALRQMKLPEKAFWAAKGRR